MTAKKIPLNMKFQDLRTAVSDEILERDEPVETGMLALISHMHHFQLGAPGTGKSALIERVAARINGLPTGGYFHYLLDKFTKPEELFGPPNLKTLMEDHRLVREIDYALPSAYFAFVDEIFKGNSSVLNALLLIMNERRYNTDRGPQKAPLISIFSASNELPESKELGAMWDRLHIRHWIEPIQGGGSFAEMLTAEWDPDPKPLITLADIQTAHAESQKVIVGDNIIDALYDLRLQMRAESLEPSDRRWRNALQVIRAAAWLEGCGSVEIRHARVLAHMLWDTDETRRKVQNMCLTLADPMERELQEFYDDIHGWEKDWRTALGTIESEDGRQAAAVEIWSKIQRVLAKVKSIEAKASSEGRTMPTAKALVGTTDALIAEIIRDGFDLDFFALMSEKK